MLMFSGIVSQKIFCHYSPIVQMNSQWNHFERERVEEVSENEKVFVEEKTGLDGGFGVLTFLGLKRLCPGHRDAGGRYRL
jgi:hypothetical protein